MGATNTLILMGPIFAVLVYVVDVLKGLIPVLIAKSFLGTEVSMGLCAFAAVLGHDYPIYVGFKGGKGVATTTGVMFGIHAVIIWMVISLWFVMVILFDQFIVASLLSLLALPIFMYFFGLSNTYIILGIALFVLGLFTHRHDIVKIYKGEGKRALSSAKKYFSKKKV